MHGGIVIGDQLVVALNRPVRRGHPSGPPRYSPTTMDSCVSGSSSGFIAGGWPRRRTRPNRGRCSSAPTFEGYCGLRWLGLHNSARLGRGGDHRVGLIGMQFMNFRLEYAHRFAQRPRGIRQSLRTEQHDDHHSNDRPVPGTETAH